MTDRRRRDARRRTLVAGLLGVGLLAGGGWGLLLPAVALVALVHFAHQLVPPPPDDDRPVHPGLALVVVINAAVILGVQILVLGLGLVTPARFATEPSRVAATDGITGGCTPIAAREPNCPEGRARSG